MSDLREHVQLLREYMFSASSYPGPEPGTMGVVATMPYASNPYGSTLSDQDEKAAIQKRKLADKRQRLRKIAQWLSRGPQ